MLALLIVIRALYITIIYRILVVHIHIYLYTYIICYYELSDIYLYIHISSAMSIVCSLPTRGIFCIGLVFPPPHVGLCVFVVFIRINSISLHILKAKHTLYISLSFGVCDVVLFDGGPRGKGASVLRRCVCVIISPPFLWPRSDPQKNTTPNPCTHLPATKPKKNIGSHMSIATGARRRLIGGRRCLQGARIVCGRAATADGRMLARLVRGRRCAGWRGGQLHRRW